MNTLKNKGRIAAIDNGRISVSDEFAGMEPNGNGKCAYCMMGHVYTMEDFKEAVRKMRENQGEGENGTTLVSTYDGTNFRENKALKKASSGYLYIKNIGMAPTFIITKNGRCIPALPGEIVILKDGNTENPAAKPKKPSMQERLRYMFWGEDEARYEVAFAH